MLSNNAEKTVHDLERIANAEFKRNRKAEKLAKYGFNKPHEK